MARNAFHAHATAISVPYLVHFTRVVNLPSIMQHGLYPMSRMDEIGAVPQINDDLRLDGHLGGISLSIGFPNYRMFYRLRQENPCVHWSVLVIDPTVLWVKDCAFCRHNAADARISHQPLGQLKTIEAFVGMYAEIEGLDSRLNQRLRTYDPTDGQAEVLVFDVIEPQFILRAAFEHEAVRLDHEGIFNGRLLETHRTGRGFFAARSFVR
ncbi:TPA: DUF4433 domain-containing protein [Pseudomonas aeruginosa]|nr:DUF4433 domain-containing protein [Pseudomonas aeruginosa]